MDDPAAIDGVDSVLGSLLAGNDEHVASLPEGYFDEVLDDQHPAVVSICCSDSRVPQERMWAVDEPGAVFTPSNIGNQVRDDREDEPTVDGSLLYPIHHAGTTAIAVVGHTGCGAVTAAYDVATGEDPPGPPGVANRIELLVPVIEAGLESDLVDASAPDERVIDRLVEYNVHRQVRFCRESDSVPDDVAVYGFVYDFRGVYGDEPGRASLVNLDGETDPDAIADRLPASHEGVARSLLYEGETRTDEAR